MKSKNPHFVILFVLTLFWLRSAAAQPLLQQPLNVLLAGDDPSQLFTFDLPADPLTPVVVRFDGVFQNLDSSETGVRYWIWWTVPESGGYDIDWTRLPGSGALPVQYEQTLGFTPDSITLLLEGGGPGDHFQFTGDISVQAVPEPGAVTLLAS